MRVSILVVARDPALRATLEQKFRPAGYTVACISDPATAQESIYSLDPRLVVIDDRLVGLTGLELMRRFRRDGRTALLPIVLLSDNASENAKVTAFDAGADEYLAKPFSMPELIARAKALLRRTGSGPMRQILQYADFRLDPATCRLEGAKGAIDLKPQELRMFQTFIARPDVVFTRQMLLDTVWGSNNCRSERVVDVQVHRLRIALSRSGYTDVIEAIRGVGYRFSVPPSPTPRRPGQSTYRRMQAQSSRGAVARQNP